MRLHTFLGLLILAAVGGGLAWIYHHGGSAPPEPATDLQANNSESSGGPRGQIVPLTPDDDFTGLAFIGVGKKVDEEQVAQPQQVRIPAIGRAKETDEAAEGSIHAPRLTRNFPRPLVMLGIRRLPEVGGTSEDPVAIPHSTAQQPNYAPTNPPPRRPALPLIDVEAKGTRSMNATVAARPATHTVVDGDTLPLIAEQYYGDTALAEKIYQANQGVLPSPQILPIGAELVLPASE